MKTMKTTMSKSFPGRVECQGQRIYRNNDNDNNKDDNDNDNDNDNSDNDNDNDINDNDNDNDDNDNDNDGEMSLIVMTRFITVDSFVSDLYLTREIYYESRIL